MTNELATQIKEGDKGLMSSYEALEDYIEELEVALDGQV